MFTKIEKKIRTKRLAKATFTYKASCSILYKTIVGLVAVSFIISLGACSKTQTVKKPINDLAFAGDMLSFSEVIAGQPESNVRMIITDAFLRIDDGIEKQDFMLFDRKTKIIYNIVGEEKTVAVIKPPAADIIQQNKKTPYPILWNVESQTSSALMKTDDKNAATATHYRLKLNQQECYNLVAIDQGMEKPLAAIREYREALAEHLKTRFTPQKGQACYEAINILTPLNRLHQGFPIREWSAYGYQRFLIGHKKRIKFPKRLFEFPEDYRQFSL